MGYGGIFGQKTIVDAFTKEQTLSNATAALYGYSDSGSVVPDNLFATLSKATLYHSIPTPKYQEVTVNLSTAQEGDTIQLIENGKAVDFYVAKLNYESALNGAGRTLVVRKDVYESRQWNISNYNTWATSSIRSWLNNTYKGLLDSDIQAVMGTTTYRYTPGNNDMNVTTRSDAVFLLSVTELGFANSSANVEGPILYIASILRIAYQNGSPTSQWTRSPWTGSNNTVWWISSGGTISNGREPSYSYGVRPIFTLPQDFTLTFYVDKEGNVHDEQEYETVGSITDVQGNPITIGAQIETGSYMGTGTYGADNPNSLTFGFEPKVLKLSIRDDSTTSYKKIIFSPFIFPSTISNANSFSSSSGNVTGITISWEGNTVKWYSTDSVSQGNGPTGTVDYYAIG